MKKRPAETAAGLAGAIAALAAAAAGIDDATVIAAGALVIGAIPAAVTALVNAGGIRGAVRRLWRGRG